MKKYAMLIYIALVIKNYCNYLHILEGRLLFYDRQVSINCVFAAFLLISEIAVETAGTVPILFQNITQYSYSFRSALFYKHR